MHLRGCVLTCERVSQFCLNEEKKRKERNKQHRIHYRVFMCLYSIHRLSRYTDRHGPVPKNLHAHPCKLVWI